MKLEFERPEYCQECEIAELKLKTAMVYAGNDIPYAISRQIVCVHDAACKRIYDKMSKVD